MEQSPFLRSQKSLSQEIPCLLNPKVYYCVHKSLPLVPTLSQIIKSTSSHPLSIRFILIIPSMHRSSKVVSLRFSNQNTVSDN
jgi:hypothetical protein